MTENNNNFKETFNKRDWVSLRDYFCSKISALEEKLELNLKLVQIARDKAEQTMNERLERMNEFRSALKDQAGNFISRTELQILLKVQEEKIDNLQKIVYIGLGIVIAINVVLGFLK